MRKNKFCSFLKDNNFIGVENLSLFLLASAALTFEINLTRIFSVSQFYHYAFMIVSIALLGYGASGTVLAIFPAISNRDPGRVMGWLSILTAITILGSYTLINKVPFDSYSIPWNWKQMLVLAVHYVALAAPFFFSGMAAGMLLAAFPQRTGQTYAVNMVGSAAGCIVALIAPAYLGGEGTAVFASGLAGFAAVICALQMLKRESIVGLVSRKHVVWITLLVLSLAVILLVASDAYMRISGRETFAWLELHVSPYKRLSYTLQYPDAEVVYRRWNAFSRIDVVSSAGIRSLPGLSYRYLEPFPTQDGLLVDADNLTPIVRAEGDLDFVEYLPSAIAYQLHPHADVLILKSGAGLEILTALESGADRVTAVEENRLIVDASAHIYDNPLVEKVLEFDRSYIRRTDDKFDIVLLSLTSSYHPVRSGAYSLMEDYRYTVESVKDILARLNPDGYLVLTRWLQTPPSEYLRAFGLAVEALEQSGFDPSNQVAAMRGYNTGTIIVKASSFTALEIDKISDFSQQRAFDVVYFPGIEPEDVNKYNVLDEPLYFKTFTDLLNSSPRREFYEQYLFDVSPVSDNQPFFGHYFKWSQAKQLWAELGKFWQPFGGAGYFVVLALLLLAVLSAGVLILLPVIMSVLSKKPQIPTGSQVSSLALVLYFCWIGFGYLLVEIPLIQRFILYLGHPSYALTVVLFSILFFSGIGSQFSHKVPLQLGLIVLVLLLVLVTLLLPFLFDLTLGFPFGLRVAITMAVLSPLGFMMGIPFPQGLRLLLGTERRSSRTGWVWGINGAASVVSAVLAALLALSFGFDWVFRIGAVCYAGAWLTVLIVQAKASSQHLPR